METKVKKLLTQKKKITQAQEDLLLKKFAKQRSYNNNKGYYFSKT